MRELERRAELGRFLKDRRARLSPAEVGLPATPRRRVRGLRREEVAALANIGVSWYTALENGDGQGVSDATLIAVAEALRLSESERQYLFGLAGRVDGAEEVLVPDPVFVDAINAISFPAYLITVTWVIIACNEAFRRVWKIDESELKFDVSRLFIDREARAMHGEHFATNITPVVAMVRSGIGRRPNLQGLRDLRDRLLADDEVRKIWDAFEISDPFVPTRAEIQSPMGAFNYEALTFPIPAVLQALVIQVPDSASRERLAFATPRSTASWGEKFGLFDR